MEDLIDAGGSSAKVEELRDTTGTTILKIIGEIDMSNVDIVRTDVNLAIEDGSQHIIFDLGELQFLDTSGLALLLGIAERVAVVELRSPLPMIRRLIELTGLTTAFVITR